MVGIFNMTTRQPADRRETSTIEEIREALGAVAAAEPAVFWLYSGSDGRWCVRREGAEGEIEFSTRDQALEHLRKEAMRCSSFRLMLEGTDGHVTREYFNWPGQTPHD